MTGTLPASLPQLLMVFSNTSQTCFSLTIWAIPQNGTLLSKSPRNLTEGSWKTGFFPLISGAPWTVDAERSASPTRSQAPEAPIGRLFLRRSSCGLGGKPKEQKHAGIVGLPQKNTRPVGPLVRGAPVPWTCRFQKKNGSHMLKRSGRDGFQVVAS